MDNFINCILFDGDFPALQPFFIVWNYASTRSRLLIHRKWHYCKNVSALNEMRGLASEKSSHNKAKDFSSFHSSK